VVQFAKLRIAGFKSFVDATELLIEPGLTAVVGPNGCGKSNLLEGLRWAMGEGSAKQMRGGEMDDVIFNGTAERPARNLAEATILLDNSGRTAPAPYNEHDEIEVTRRIERGAGSGYRINGRDVRARDVQLLFNDISTGARSTAIVSQGRVGALINAKPIQRRLLLEEAAGITGLHSRRHEAELRLRAAESNLERLDDVITALSEQFQGLRRQARQAARYRSISDRIRRAEAVLLYLKWSDAKAEVTAAEARLAEAEGQVTDFTRQAAAAAAEQSEAAADLPQLRQTEAAAAAELQRMVVAREAIDTEEERLQTVREEYDMRLRQVDADMAREQALIDDAARALERLQAEQAAIAEAQAGEADAEARAAEECGIAESVAETIEAELTELTERVASAEARRTTLLRQESELEERRQRLGDRAEAVAEERAALAAEGDDGTALARAEQAVTDAQEGLEAARRESAEAEAAQRAARAAEASAREELRQAEELRSRLRAEEHGLTALLAGDDDSRGQPVLDDITVEPGYEAALGAALGDDLTAPLDDGAAVHWRSLPPLADSAPLPAGAEPLDRFVAAPAALARRLSQIGVVADEAAGRALRDRLARGQRLVSKDGALWRWDGFTVGAGAATAAAARLEQRNRLAEVRGELTKADALAETATGCHAQTHEAAEAALERERLAQDRVREALSELASARDAHGEAAREAAARTSRQAALEEAAERLALDLADVDGQLAAAREAAGEASPDIDGERERLAELRRRTGESRATLVERRRAHERLKDEVAARHDRLTAIAGEREGWQARLDNGHSQLAQLEERRQGAVQAIERVAARPQELDAQRQELLQRIEGAEGRRRTAADKLAEAETALAAVERRLKAAEASLADAREARGRCEGAVSQARQALQTVVERVRERLDCAPDQTLAIGEVKEGEALPDLETMEVRLDRLFRERDNMGPVNLRAEQEAAELEAQITSLESERGDLSSAIHRLRHGIAELNREGRERLLASFDEVNRHFEELFVRLFGGGRAHLQLVDSDDPLEAGLEIMASPPGKRLQVMSLLSGGEQALTALSLLFAVFLTNPAPICVLDEVDAPLDDANVERFCNLIEEIAHASQTRFLLITHHRLTMARMDRLFGVTMPERGVSQLVSVDLQQAEYMRATA